MDVTTLYVTASSQEEALKIASDLLDRRLIACANIFDGMTSVYRWDGEVRNSAEVALLLKTRSSLIEAATKRVQELHSYECPCIVAWNSVGGNVSFSDWVAAETALPLEQNGCAERELPKLPR